MLADICEGVVAVPVAVVANTAAFVSAAEKAAEAASALLTERSSFLCPDQRSFIH